MSASVTQGGHKKWVLRNCLKVAVCPRILNESGSWFQNYNRTSNTEGDGCHSVCLTVCYVAVTVQVNWCIMYMCASSADNDNVRGEWCLGRHDVVLCSAHHPVPDAAVHLSEWDPAVGLLVPWQLLPQHEQIRLVALQCNVIISMVMTVLNKSQTPQMVVNQIRASECYKTAFQRNDRLTSNCHDYNYSNTSVDICWTEPGFRHWWVLVTLMPLCP